MTNPVDELLRVLLDKPKPDELLAVDWDRLFQIFGRIMLQRWTEYYDRAPAKDAKP